MPEVSEVENDAKVKSTLTPALSRRERGLTEVSDVKHRPERPSRLWIQGERSRFLKLCMDLINYGFGEIVHVGQALLHPPIGSLSLGRGLG